MTRGQRGWRMVLLAALVLPFVLPLTHAVTTAPARARIGDTRSLVASDHQQAAVWTLSTVAAIPLGALDAVTPAGPPRTALSRLGVVRLPDTVAAIARTESAAHGRSPPTTPR